MIFNLKKIIFRIEMQLEFAAKKKRKGKASAKPKKQAPKPKEKKDKPKKKRGFPGWVISLIILLVILLVILLIIGGGLVLLSRIQHDKGRPPESLDRWIENNLIQELTSKPNEWYNYWHNDWATKGDDIWVVGGITFTTDRYLSETINFVYHSPDGGGNWRVSWRTDLRDDTRFFGAKKISVKNKERISVLLWGQYNQMVTLRTTNGGATWEIK